MHRVSFVRCCADFRLHRNPLLCEILHTPTHASGLSQIASVTLKMHDLKMTDKENYGSAKMQDWKMTDKLLANCEHNYVCIFDVYLANYRKTLLELD